MQQDRFEFVADADGENIPIPAVYKNNCKGKMNIIAFRQPGESRDGKKKKFTPAFLVDTTGFKFNREEANER